MYLPSLTCPTGTSHPPCRTYICIDKNTDQCLTLLTAIGYLLFLIQWFTEISINAFRQSRCLMLDVLLVIFLNGYVTEMTKEIESRTREELAEVYRSVVILVICVMGCEWRRYKFLSLSIARSGDPNTLCSNISTERQICLSCLSSNFICLLFLGI